MATRLQPDTASTLASAIYIKHRAEHEQHEDVDAFNAPSECHDLVSRSQERESVEFWRMWKRRTHLNQKKLKQMLRSRTTGKFCHFVLGI
jgi:hypothetical protein